MKREDAINYLQRKGKVRGPIKKVTEYVTKMVPKKTKKTYFVDPEFNKKEEEAITEVMKEGKIYGDPSAEIQW